MLELVYKLNLPPLQSIIKEDSGVLESKKKYCIYKSSEIIKPEWTFWNNLNFDNAVSFYRSSGNDDSSGIHTDHHTENALPWAVNWIYGGNGTLEFWLPEQIEKREWKLNKTDNNSSAKVPIITTSQPAYKTYVQTPGAYLTNTSFPHRAKGWDSRLAISIRASANFSMPWEEVVEKFKKYM